MYEEVSGSFADTVARAIAWLEDQRGNDFFLFLHSYAVHHPYTPTRESLAFLEPAYEGPLPDEISVELLKRINAGEVKISDQDLKHIKNTYDAEIRDMDAALGSFLSWLKDEGLYENTLLVFTSDHGEEFGEHGWVGWHAHSLFDELLRIPLLVKLPRSTQAGSVVEGLVQSIDVAPTALDYLHLPAQGAFRGVSLRSQVDRNPEPPRAAVSQRDGSQESLHTSVRTDRWKLNGNALFDLENDPGEKRPLAADQRTDVRRQLRALQGNALRGRAVPAKPVELDEKTRAQLRALGYLD